MTSLAVACRSSSVGLASGMNPRSESDLDSGYHERGITFVDAIGSLAAVQTRDVAICEDASGGGLARFPVGGNVAQRNAVATLFERLRVGHTRHTRIENTRRQRVGRSGGTDFDHARSLHGRAG